MQEFICMLSTIVIKKYSCYLKKTSVDIFSPLSISYHYLYHFHISSFVHASSCVCMCLGAFLQGWFHGLIRSHGLSFSAYSIRGKGVGDYRMLFRAKKSFFLKGGVLFLYFSSMEYITI